MLLTQKIFLFFNKTQIAVDPESSSLNSSSDKPKKLHHKTSQQKWQINIWNKTDTQVSNSIQL